MLYLMFERKLASQRGHRTHPERDAVRRAIFRSLSWRDRSDRVRGRQLIPAANPRPTGNLQLIGPAHEMQGPQRS
jgi:hypothetical protein